MNPILNLLIGPVLDLIGRFIPDPAQKAAAQIELLKLQETAQFKELDAAVQLGQQQADINKVEAASPNLFIAGWRPAVGWVCALSFAVQYLIAPFATWGSALAGHPIEFPKLDMTTMLPALLGMLGLGGYRTIEKLQGAQGNH